MTSFEQPNNQAPIDALENDDDLDPDLEAFLGRLKDAWAGITEKKWKLHELYNNGEQDKLQDEIDELADDICAHNPEYQQNLAQIKSLRSYRNPDQEALAPLVAEQNRIFDTVRGLVVYEADLPDEARLSAIELSREVVAQKLNDTFQGSPYTAREALEALEIITVNEETGKDILRFPSELVPGNTTMLWNTYLASVCVHVEASDALEQKKAGSSQAAVSEADATRKYAHDAVTREVHAILDLHSTDAWKFEDTREKVLAALRDQVFPNHAAAVSAQAKALMDAHAIHLDVSKHLSSYH